MIKANTEILSKIDFDCGDEDLNEFLLKDSFDNINNNLCTIFLCKNQNRVVGFFSLSADSIRINNQLVVDYPAYPAVKIGRLAVCKDFQNLHIGSLMISWIVGFCRNLSSEIGLRFISVDAYNNEKTIRFYENNFFVGLESVMNNKRRRNIPMYRDICEKIN
ncbi:MAG: GNAT family N-acetyltransferase [Methanobrevibacter sp.]|nr:GNAT family N-acetyltransferase [Methanobrevibacter sp.]